ncbi:MAG: hypothetical protein KF874_13405 [Rhizobiaceae bacterium]|nr:hypothetical protein [Rhizobiaceae bacterium]
MTQAEDKQDDNTKLHPSNQLTGKQADRNSSSYAVGYRKPPVMTRFKKGQSGNPRGRPKGSHSPKALLRAALSAPVRVSEAGEIKTIAQREALFRALVARAVKGDNRATAQVIDLIERYGLSDDLNEGDMKITVTIGGQEPMAPYKRRQ